MLFALLFASCEKEEALWQLPPAGNETIASVEMGEEYENVIFFTLEDGSTELRKNEVWDIGFASAPGAFYLTMNGGKGIQVYNTHDTSFLKTSYTANADSPWQWDNPNGDQDSTAFGTWCDPNGVSKNEVYIIDLGAKASPRYKKMQLTGGSTQSYSFRHAALDNTFLSETVVQRDAKKVVTCFSFTQNRVVDFEPPRWDLVFTKYRHVYYDMDPVTPYPVTGVLINTSEVTVAETTTLPFADITYEKVAGLTLTTKADEIGFDWKFFDLNGSSKYIINDKKIYLIKDRNGVLYKLQFIGFYNEQGIKGTPKFIYQRL